MSKEVKVLAIISITILSLLIVTVLFCGIRGSGSPSGNPSNMDWNFCSIGRDQGAARHCYLYRQSWLYYWTHDERYDPNRWF